MQSLSKPTQSIWVHPEDPGCVQIIDQRFLPHQIIIKDLRTLEDAALAIEEMQVRGAPLIGVTAGYGVYMALREGIDFDRAYERLIRTRPTAVNLRWALEYQKKCLQGTQNPVETGFRTACQIEREDILTCEQIGEHGLPLIRAIWQKKRAPVQILTHCNAGWLACVAWGTKTAPIYKAHRAGIPLHIWVDETRPRNQGASLTAWQLAERGIPHTVIPDNAGGHLMQHGLVDLCLVGTDRTTRTGDVANKIGTYLKALAAFENQVPFYVAAPSSSIDWRLRDGVKEIKIEERDPDEVRYIQGWSQHGIERVLITPSASPAANYGFDVTPAKLVTGLITERGICAAREDSLLQLFPEKRV